MINSEIDINNLPNHVALIMDGNRTWARNKGLDPKEGHKQLVVALDKIIKHAYKLGIEQVTFYAFSTENWKRSKEEVDFLMELYNNYVKDKGYYYADMCSARAGHSEHQTGLAFDLNTIDDSFTNTPEGKWVHDNCHKYGLILRYPKGKDNITGYMHESWHLRYVGIDLATKLYNDGNWITLEEYFGIDSKYSY